MPEISGNFKMFEWVEVVCTLRGGTIFFLSWLNYQKPRSISMKWIIIIINKNKNTCRRAK